MASKCIFRCGSWSVKTVIGKHTTLHLLCFPSQRWIIGCRRWLRYKFRYRKKRTNAMRLTRFIIQAAIVYLWNYLSFTLRKKKTFLWGYSILHRNFNYGNQEKIPSRKQYKFKLFSFEDNRVYFLLLFITIPIFSWTASSLIYIEKWEPAEWKDAMYYKMIILVVIRGK